MDLVVIHKRRRRVLQSSLGEILGVEGRLIYILLLPLPCWLAFAKIDIVDVVAWVLLIVTLLLVLRQSLLHTKHNIYTPSNGLTHAHAHMSKDA